MDISPSDSLVTAASQSPVQAAAEGLTKAINGYLGNQTDLQNQATKNQMDIQKELTIAKGKHDIDNPPVDPEYVDPESVGKLWDTVDPKMGQAVRQTVIAYNNDPRNKGNSLTWNDYKSHLQDQIDKVGQLTGDANKAKNTRHYLGNSPQGNAIFGDNSGNLYDPNGDIYKGEVLPKSSTMATAQTRSSAEFAKTIIPHIQEMRNLINEADAKGYIGPAAGRIYNQFMAGTIGSTGNDDADQLLGRLRATDSLLKSGAMKVHFGSRGGQTMYEQFSKILNTGKQSKAQLNGSLDGIESFMQGYAGAGTSQGVTTEAPTDIESKRAALRTKLAL